MELSSLVMSIQHRTNLHVRPAFEYLETLFHLQDKHASGSLFVAIIMKWNSSSETVVKFTASVETLRKIVFELAAF